MHLPADMVANLVPFDNPRGYVTNSDIDLEGRILQKDYDDQCFNVQ